MPAAHPPSSPPAPPAAAAPTAPPAPAAIDASARVPLTLFIASAVLWLLAGTVLALIASFKLHTPQSLASMEWLAFGRVRPAHLNTAVYGWAANAAFAVMFWLMARLSRSVLRHGAILSLAAALWNIGVAIGVIGILKGDTTAVEWLEMPPYATPLLIIAYALVGAWAVATFRLGNARRIYVSQWYLLAALFWFPWLYTVAQIMAVLEPARGTLQALVNWWFADNLAGLWFTPVGLAAAYYFIPKILGKPVHSYALSMLGFWTLALFSSWAGASHLSGGPVPAWVVTAGIAASLMMVIPVAANAINLHKTMSGGFATLRHSPALRFIVFGAVNYTLAALAASLMASRDISETLQFTHFAVAHAHHGMYAFFSMVMFGSLYYILPRLLRREWPNATLIRIHFWACATGALLAIASLSLGGLVQGLMMNETAPDGAVANTFLHVVQATLPWLFSRSVAGILLATGHIAFAINVAWLLAASRAPAPALPLSPEPSEP